MTIEELEHSVIVLKSGPGGHEPAESEQVLPERPGQLQEGHEVARSAAAACILQLGEQMTMLCAKLRHHGLPEALAGEKEDSAAQHLEWFSLCCWNAALSAAGEHQQNINTYIMYGHHSSFSLNPAVLLCMWSRHRFMGPCFTASQGAHPHLIWLQRGGLCCPCPPQQLCLLVQNTYDARA
jgi:hypothetical protein